MNGYLVIEDLINDGHVGKDQLLEVEDLVLQGSWGTDEEAARDPSFTYGKELNGRHYDIQQNDIRHYDT
jgi:hypothetical protein